MNINYRVEVGEKIINSTKIIVKDKVPNYSADEERKMRNVIEEQVFDVFVKFYHT